MWAGWETPVVIGEGLEQKAHLSCCVQEGDEKVLTREQDRSAFHARETTQDRSRTVEGRGSPEAEAHASALGRDDEKRPRRSQKGEEVECFSREPMVVLGMSCHSRPPPKLLALTCRRACYY